MKSLKNIKKIFFIFLYGVLFNGIFAQNICDDFEVIHLEFEPQTEWGNLLRFDILIPDTSIYAPYFFLQSNDEYIEITDSTDSYFWITGPKITNLLFHFEYDSIPENHFYNGNILMVSSDNVLSCFLDFNFLVNSELDIGDVNSDGEINLFDIFTTLNLILTYNYHSNYDTNNDFLINVLDILFLINIIMEN